MTLNLDQLETFADLVELGSYSLVAKRKNITQPAVSQRVRQLERHFGVKLVEQLGRRTQVTAAGRVLYEHIHRIETALSDTMDALSDYRLEAKGRVVLAAGASACIYLLPPILRQLKQKHPGLDLAVRTGATVDIISWVEDGQADIAVVSAVESRQNLHATPFVADELVAIYPPGKPVRQPYFTPHDLKDKPLIMPPRGGGTHNLILSWFANAGLKLTPVMELGSIEAIKRLVGAQLGYAIVPSIALSEMQDAAFVPLFPRIHRVLCVTVRHDKILSKSVREVMTELQRFAEGGPKLPSALRSHGTALTNEAGPQPKSSGTVPWPRGPRPAPSRDRGRLGKNTPT